MASTVPGPAVDVVRAVTHAVEAATGGDVATYDDASARLADQPAGGRVLGDVLRSLLEDIHSDGFTSDDMVLVIGRCYRAATEWLPPVRVDVTVLLAVLTGALGIHPAATDDPDSLAHERTDSDDSEPLTWRDYAWHAPLLVADLLPFAPATLDTYLEAAFAEYAREAREESP